MFNNIKLTKYNKYKKFGKSEKKKIPIFFSFSFFSKIFRFRFFLGRKPFSKFFRKIDSNVEIFWRILDVRFYLRHNRELPEWHKRLDHQRKIQLGRKSVYCYPKDQIRWNLSRTSDKEFHMAHGQSKAKSGEVQCVQIVQFCPLVHCLVVGRMPD